MKYPILFLLLASRLLCGTLTYTFVHPYALSGWESANQTVNWSDPAPIPRFSIPGQKLDSVTVTLHASGSFIYYGENTAPVPVLNTLTAGVVGAFGGATIPWGGFQSTLVPAYDGVTDQHGASGFLLYVQTVSDSTTVLAPSGWTGTGTRPLTLSASGVVTETGGTGAPGSVFGYSEFYLSATVTYTYSPARHWEDDDEDCDDDRDDRHDRHHGNRR